MNKRNLSVISEIIIHLNDSKHLKHDAIVIDQWHKKRFQSVPTGELKYIGYHYVILFDGTVQEGRNLEWYGQHCSGHNWESIGICLQGTKDSEKTQDQLKALEKQIIKLKDMLPNIKKVSQHSDYSKSKPHCAGFTDSQMKYFNQLVK